MLAWPLLYLGRTPRTLITKGIDIMASSIPSNADKATALVKAAADEAFIELSKKQAGILVEAVERDMATLTDKVLDDEGRLARLEAQTRALSDAVVAMTKIDEAVAPAVRAVQTEMHTRRRATDAHPDLPSGRRGTDLHQEASAVAALDVAGLRDIARKVLETQTAATIHDDEQRKK